MDRALVTSAAPYGIVSFELAGSLERAEAIIQSWSERARSVAMLIQGFDYLYLIVYSAWFSMAAVSLGARLKGAWQSAGLLIGWSVLVAAALDAVENYALILQLLHGASSGHAHLALWCALAKFALVGVAAAFLLVGVAAWMLRRRA